MKPVSIQEYDFEKVYDLLDELAREMLRVENAYQPVLEQVHHNFQLSATNLLHYLVMRSSEIREAQEYLHKIGLSSLANCESHAHAQVQQVLRWLNPSHVQREEVSCTFEVASKLRQRHTEELLGIRPDTGKPHIMVTFSAAMADNRMMVEEMLMAGMTVARLNCAHDNPDVWARMIEALKRAVAKTGHNCKIYMDLAGPKIRVAALPAAANASGGLSLREGDELLLLPPGKPGEETERPAIWVEPAEMLGMIRPGEHIFFDDGKFEARVLENTADWARVRIRRISTKKPFLKPEKGINLPDSDLQIAPLTAEDKRNIPFICRYADMVGYSFVSEPADVELLRAELKKHSPNKHTPDIILKIERLSAVQHLPALLINGMKDPSVGVMIARGDLAVEIGFERLSEIQEEILWICEAAHVPVIWATQVLESLNKTGFATRSEITDAAYGVRAECVMLNKGRYITKTIETLDNILRRQMAHLDKKRYILRPLGIARNFLSGTYGFGNTE
jgi:pyruvate kinase